MEDTIELANFTNQKNEMTGDFYRSVDQSYSSILSKYNDYETIRSTKNTEEESLCIFPAGGPCLIDNSLFGGEFLESSNI